MKKVYVGPSRMWMWMFELGQVRYDGCVVVEGEGEREGKDVDIVKK